MSVVVVVGGQWGDEGKGKIVDMLAEQARLVARCTGGNNAGHTVINELGEFRMHLVPSGIFYPTTTCLMGNGLVIDPQVLLGEIDMLHSRGIKTEGRLFISSRAHVIMPYHILLDKLEEGARGGNAIGTTGRGIGPAYADKISRIGVRMSDLLDPAVLRKRLSTTLELKNKLITLIYGAEPLDLDAICDEYLAYGQRLASYIAETSVMAQEAVAKGENLLLEGAQGALLDIDYGTYPYVTSSSPIAGGACLGVGIGPTTVDRAIGVFKAYSTRVGSGPYPTELNDAVGQDIRERAHEYGTTTGRPRRCGWFDAVLGRFSVGINGLDGLAITRLDILDTLPTLKICTAYRLDGKTIDYPPAVLSEYERCEPIFEEMPGWQASTTNAKTYEELPAGAQNYIRRISELLGCKAVLISVGPAREQTIITEKLF
jgi:adenylosuccinate synthase